MLLYNSNLCRHWHKFANGDTLSQTGWGHQSWSILLHEIYDTVHEIQMRCNFVKFFAFLSTLSLCIMDCLNITSQLSNTLTHGKFDSSTQFTHPHQGSAPRAPCACPRVRVCFGIVATRDEIISKCYSMTNNHSIHIHLKLESHLLLQRIQASMEIFHDNYHV
jgi:hypothetical protein